jgi:ATP adenylyltransferase
LKCRRLAIGGDADNNRAVETLFAPWRMDYIGKGGTETGCIFCDLPASPRDEENLILYRGRDAFVILNRYPYVSGHLMVVPFRHASDPSALDAHEWAAAFELVRPAVRVLEAEYRPEGFNIGINLGTAAGAGVAGHLHIHVVPRWGGDTNFVSVVGGARVIPEALEETYRRLLPSFRALKEEVVR